MKTFSRLLGKNSVDSNDFRLRIDVRKPFFQDIRLKFADCGVERGKLAVEVRNGNFVRVNERYVFKT